MIHIDVFVPALDETFELRCDENVPISVIMDELYHLLMRKNGREPDKDQTKQNGFWFCHVDKRRILSGDKCFREQSIVHGDTLMFI